ncbi:hypothetical protein ASPZODRAFT_133825 [Penicilliopsis zonata CBS 506.65]|uniref:Enoyl reductase (ER) domain-containing protein n=1 Tax=Penicilliopsis zonata CBS 506.65 TaxID=1073090 RepID=A0A1L9SDH2_9EURO|nr:hypothetical protein ASPZODRAFT_133825 [Penicilliopsis zonata CBS 506.65]OJJ45192.1 hypothetical protein ASPZODRAFT_133825 [Penicilliopsis zonata CBS 506.65]
MKALTFNTPGDAAIREIPLPPLRPEYMLIKISTIALNPTDWKHINHAKGADPFSIVGCDYAGTVVSLGPGVAKSFSVGEKVYGCAHGSNQSEATDGVFAEYALVKGDVSMRVPFSLSIGLEDLCTIPLGAITVGQGLFQPGHNKSIGLAWPEDGLGKGEYVFISGGSTATGTLGIQLAKMAGYTVLTTCSPQNEELVRSRGADHIFDYNDEDCGKKIREFTQNTLRYAWDVAYSPELCDAALSSDSSIVHFGTVHPDDPPREGFASFSSTSMYTMFGEKFDKYGHHYPASEEDFEFAKRWTTFIERIVAEGKLIPHPKRVENGGLDGILDGLAMLKEEKIRGEKVVYRIE